MPNLASSTYQAPFGFGNGHVQSIYPTLFRRVEMVTSHRERIELPDGDFLDLDWNGPERTGDRLAVLSHGMEGNSRNTYVQGMAAALQKRGWDVVAWNFRGCSGEPNRLVKAYHSGATSDLQAVIDRAFESRGHEWAALVGFSLGGNLTLKYVGERGGKIDPRIVGAVAFSVPCDLSCSARTMEGLAQWIYKRRFFRELKKKIREKESMFPGRMNIDSLDGMKTFRDLDDRYTAPLNGFEDAADYWKRCSCKRELHRIRVPTLLVNAIDDPFLGERCYPREEAEISENFFFEAPGDGGHLGFIPDDRSGEYWSETRAADFLEPSG